MNPITARDLTREFPRSPLDELEGYTWLPRLIDKVRALNAGKLGDYTPYPCGGDQGFLKAFGLDGEALGNLIKGGASDAEVVAWVKAQATAETPAARAAYRERQLSPLSGEMAEYLKGLVAETRKAMPDKDFSKVDNFTRLICVEEGHPCPGL